MPWGKSLIERGLTIGEMRYDEEIKEKKKLKLWNALSEEVRNFLIRTYELIEQSETNIIVLHYIIAHSNVHNIMNPVPKWVAWAERMQFSEPPTYTKLEIEEIAEMNFKEAADRNIVEFAYSDGTEGDFYYWLPWNDVEVYARIDETESLSNDVCRICGSSNLKHQEFATFCNACEFLDIFISEEI
jgi:hypothetical protein